MLRGTHKKYSVKLLNIYYVLCTVHCVELWVPEGFFVFMAKPPSVSRKAAILASVK